jgi:hypothetical protein
MDPYVSQATTRASIHHFSAFVCAQQSVLVVRRHFDIVRVLRQFDIDRHGASAKDAEDTDNCQWTIIDN